MIHTLFRLCRVMKHISMQSHATVKMNTHFKCRNAAYPRTEGTVLRQDVPDEYVPWDKDWPEYSPPYYTCKKIINQSWADPELDNKPFQPQWNVLDGNVNRKSFHGDYRILNGYPLNPVGRTGLRGRGVLGRWGPNHAADPIITRWKTINGDKIEDGTSSKPILQFVAIKRRDCGEWAIPGGMVDPGEVISSTLKREFLEEALNSLEISQESKERFENQVEVLYSTGVPIYTGYVDDVRNTDNSWIETSAFNFHDESGDVVGSLDLNAGDDAVGVSWMDLSRTLPLYASHSAFMELVASKHGAHW